MYYKILSITVDRTLVQIIACQTINKPNLVCFPLPKPIKDRNCWAIPKGITNSQPNHLNTWYHTGKIEGRERNRWTDYSDGSTQETHPKPPAGSGTSRRLKLSLEGILSRISCQEKTTIFEGAQDFQTRVAASKTSPSRAPVPDKLDKMRE